MKVFVIKYKRTPICNLLENFSKIRCVDLCKDIVDYVIEDINKNDIDIAYFGNVLSTGNGQNICKQVTYNSGINCPSVTINKVCGSSMQAIIEGYKTIKLRDADLVLVGGTESMSNSPHYANIRSGKKIGDAVLKDSMLVDGLTDPFTNKHMGEITEELLDELEISRHELDEYTKTSYINARNATKNNKFLKEILPITIKERQQDITISEDSEINKIADLNKLGTLKSAFKNNGKLTAGNASKLSDGASVLLLASEDFIIKNSITPIAEIVDYDLIELEPRKFSIAPVESIKSILMKNRMSKDDIDLFEVNEAFSHIPVVMHKELEIAYDKINIYGGALSLGHPIGESGSRIVCTLLNSLMNENKEIGCASICNGGGGASTILFKNLT